MTLALPLKYKLMNKTKLFLEIKFHYSQYFHNFIFKRQQLSTINI